MNLRRMMGFALMATFAGSVAHADLADTMKAMNSDLKAISAQVGDASKNQNSAALADDFAKVAATAKTFVADSIAQAPAAQQAAPACRASTFRTAAIRTVSSARRCRLPW